VIAAIIMLIVVDRNTMPNSTMNARATRSSGHHQPESMKPQFQTPILNPRMIPTPPTK
jgi:hypothetical protein